MEKIIAKTSGSAVNFLGMNTMGNLLSSDVPASATSTSKFLAAQIGDQLRTKQGSPPCPDPSSPCNENGNDLAPGAQAKILLHYRTKSLAHAETSTVNPATRTQASQMRSQPRIKGSKCGHLCRDLLKSQARK